MADRLLWEAVRVERHPLIRFHAGHDDAAAVERGWEREDDESILAICSSEARALLTNDVADLTAIHRRWAADGRSHSGLLFTSDAGMPRGRATIGRFVEALDALLRLHPGQDDFRDRAHWL